jgi:Pyruvate/2-oxoacid:ferredoxin oxidoreductase delta subunit
MSLTPHPARVVLYEGPGAEPLCGDERLAVIRGLLERGLAVTRGGPGHPLPPKEHAEQWVVGRFPGGVPSGGSPDGPLDAAACLSLPADLAGLPEAIEARARSRGAASAGPWIPWFPVIDYERCTHCMQCLSFCLFGVYGVDEQKRIQVQNQDQCKTLCPACSRVCPEAAIVFPKYKAGPINGDVVADGDLHREKMKVDISALLGGDIYGLLRARSERSQSRFSKERSADQALTERQKCLEQLGKLASEIPPEVLRSLPSPAEIARRAAEAAARTAAARSTTPAPQP